VEKQRRKNEHACSLLRCACFLGCTGASHASMQPSRWGVWRPWWCARLDDPTLDSTSRLALLRDPQGTPRPLLLQKLRGLPAHFPKRKKRMLCRAGVHVSQCRSPDWLPPLLSSSCAGVPPPYFPSFSPGHPGAAPISTRAHAPPDLPSKLQRLTEERRLPALGMQRPGEGMGQQVLVKQMASALLEGLHFGPQ